MVLNGKVALVTGSTRNAGFGIARVLASHGAFVFVHGRNESGATSAAEGLAAELGTNQREPGGGADESDPARIAGAAESGAGRSPGFTGVGADLSSAAEIESMFRQIESVTGRLDVLVNNACHLGLGHSFLETPISFFEDVMRVNAFAYFACAQHAARLMGEAGGSIINVGSITVRRSIPNRAAYIASKGAVEGLTRAAALELAPLGIRVNCVVPGYIHTERTEKLTEEERRSIRDALPLGREAYPDDIGEAVLYFASNASRAVTGAFLSVSAGQDI